MLNVMLLETPTTKETLLTSNNPTRKSGGKRFKKIAGLSSSRNPKKLMYNNRLYQGEEVADLFNDKFVAVGLPFHHLLDSASR
jgi:hypothetical protein